MLKRLPRMDGEQLAQAGIGKLVAALVNEMMIAGMGPHMTRRGYVEELIAELDLRDGYACGGNK